MDHTTIRLRTVTDLRITKERFRYNVKIQEEILGSRIKLIRSSFIESLKTTLRKTGQQLLLLSVIRLLKNKF
jgi:hypothetical protein